MTEKGEELKAQIKSLVGEYYQEVFDNRQFSPGVNNVPVSGKVFDHVELQYLVESWLTDGSQLAGFTDNSSPHWHQFTRLKKALR